MSTMLMFHVVVLMCIYTQYAYGEHSETCDVRKLSDRFIVLKALEYDVEHGNTVTTKCKFTGKFSFANCLNGKWRVQDTECSPDKKMVDIYNDASPKKLTRKKRGWGFRIRIRVRRFVSRIGRFIGKVVCTVFSCPSHRPRDNTKPEIRSCPKDQTVTAIPIQHHAFVGWTPPTAWDNFDGQVSVHINGPYRPGGPFFERPDGRPTTVGYYAKDKSGNMATCNFNIYVRVVRCPMRTGTISDGYRKCHPSSDMVLGTVCWYGCYQGHELKGGPPRIECTASGEWSSKDEPYCQKKECSAIVPRGELSFTCSAALYFRSICTFGCNQGYDIPGHVRRTKVCLASGIWNGDDPECVDVAPPTFEQCPSTLIFFPDDNKDKAVISWDKPTVLDNKDYGLEAEQNEGPSSASEQEVNTYTIKYTAKDSAGNEAEDCTFDVIVKQLRCPRLYPLPYMAVNCTGTRRGSQCSFACDDNSVLNGSKTTYCQRKDDMPYSEWTMDTPPFCEILNGCPNLTPPTNGALACDYWLGGRFCHPSCSEGYSTLYDLPNMLICQDNGVWTQRDRISDCKDTTNPRRRYVIMAAEFYFQGDCNDVATQMEIKQKFMAAIQNSNSFLVKKMCQSPQCNVDNVKVVCGSTSKRSTESMKIFTDIYLNSGNGTLTSYQYEEEVSNVTEFLQSLQTEMNSGNFSILINDEVASLLEVTSGEINLDCPQNSVPMYNKDVVCVECPPGTFYDEVSKTCSNCLRGSYQPQRAQSSCLSCPATQTTGRVGATDVSECEDACLPGSWSNIGLPPCVECDIGYFEDGYGSTKCSQCPGNRITVKEGTKNVTDCLDFDIVFPNISTTTYTELQMFSLPLKAPFYITFHVVCQGRCDGTLFRVAASTFDDIELTSSEILINSESYDVTEYLDLSKKWFHVYLFIGEDNTALFIDGTKQQQFSSNLDILQNQNVDLNITLGGNGFVGTISQFNIVSNTTYDLDANKYSSCSSESIPSDLVNWNEFAYSSLMNSYINIPSRCDDVDGCVPDPCENGNCTDELGGYACSCIAGYKGKNCDVNIDDCIAHACQNNATCVDEVNAYSCSCDYGFTGELCEVAMVDGQWSEWDNWTECSVSCGNGTIQRRRTCSDPPPDNGGQYCNGSDTETEQCSTAPCRECSEIFETENSTLSCTNITGMITCTHTCNDGYAFDEDVKSEYTCGNETYYYWDFQTEDNPYARLPYCSEIHETTKIHVNHKAYYGMDECDSLEKEDISNLISNRITAAIRELTCITSNICTLSSYTILNCDNARKKRDTSDTNVGFTFKLSCDTTSFGTETCFYSLEDAITEFELLESNDTLVLEYNNNLYYIIQNASTSDSTVDCPIGTVPLIAYCVPCSIGHYYLNQECHSCPKGSYQDTIGQASCTSCPQGLTTEGTNSVSIDDCIVSVSVPDIDSKSIDIVLGVGISIPTLVIITVIVIALRQNKICQASKNEEKCGNRYDQIRNVKFNPNTIPHKGNQPLSIIDCEESTDNKLNSENSFVNDSYDFDDILLNGVNFPPKSHWPILTIPTEAMKCIEKKNESLLNGSIRHEQQVTPRECWTPKTSS